MEAVHCEHAERCGGCPQIGRPYAEQLAVKQRRVQAALAAYAELASVAVEPTIAADPIVEYRTRAKLVVSEQGAIGLFATGTHDVVDIPRCRVLAPALSEAAGAVRRAIAEAKGPAARVLSGRALHAIDLREVRDADGEAKVLVTLIARAPAPSDDSLAAAASAVAGASHRVASVAVSFHAGDTPQVLGRGLRVLSGETVARDRIGAGPYHLASHGAFAQAHRGQAARIHDDIARALAPVSGKRVLELYAGSGALGLALASSGAEVVLVESFGGAAAQILDAAREQHIRRVRVEIGDAAEVATTLARRGERFDACIVNPPRRGVAVEAREAIGRLAPERLVYVSCDPDTLARDLDHFARLGLRARTASPRDMIPLTDEVETLVVLERAEPPAPRTVYEDDEIVVVDKPPHEPTTPQGDARISLLDRVRRLPGCADAVPVHRLDIGTSGACIFARRSDHVAAWSAALAADDATKEYLALGRGIVNDKGVVNRALMDEGRRREARTRYKRLEVASGHSLLRVRPDQGRMHQIRRHLASIGHPILGDARYGDARTNRYAEARWGLDRTFLHCAKIALTHPRTRAPVAFEAPLCGDLATVLARMRGARE